MFIAIFWTTSLTYPSFNKESNRVLKLGGLLVTVIQYQPFDNENGSRADLWAVRELGTM